MTTVAALTEPAACESCAAKGTQAMIIFVLVDNNAGRKLRHMPLNAVPDPHGNVAVRVDGTGTLRGRVLGKDQKAAGGETLFCPHFATCKDPGAHRRSQQRADWAQARSAHAAALRRGRTKPAQPDVLPGMTRLSPGGTR